MPYVTGSAADYSALLTALRAACTSNGWTLTGSVLHKGTCFVNTEIGNFISSTLMPRLTVRPSNTLDLSDSADQRLGLGHYNTGSAQGVQFPATYHISVRSTPDEVYMVVVYNTDHHQWLAFGQSAAQGLPGTGNWAGGTLGGSLLDVSNNPVAVAGDLMTTWIGYIGGGNAGGQRGSTCALAWNTTFGSGNAEACRNFRFHSGDVGQGSVHWIGQSIDCSGIAAADTLVQHSPSSWSSEALLIPIRLTNVSSLNTRVVGNIGHARYLNVQNYTPGQVITFGSESWMVFPWYRKGSGNTNPTTNETTTKVFGWAIRYDGP